MDPKPVLLPEHLTMTTEDLKKAQESTAMRDINHLRRWLAQSDREFLIFFSKDLLDALAFEPNALLLFQQLVQCYTQHRMAIAYDTRREFNPDVNAEIEVVVCKDDRLTIAEKDRLIRKLAADLKDAVPGWTLESEPIG